MKNRIDVEVKIDVRVSDHRDRIKWKDLLSVKELLGDNDEIQTLKWIERKKSNAFSYEVDPPDEYEYVLYLTISRNREETDEEYFSRLKNEEITRKLKEEKDRLTYLELKARFEP